MYWLPWESSLTGCHGNAISEVLVAMVLQHQILEPLTNMHVTMDGVANYALNLSFCADGCHQGT